MISLTILEAPASQVLEFPAILPLRYNHKNTTEKKNQTQGNICNLHIPVIDIFLT